MEIPFHSLNGTFTNSLPDCSDYWKLQFIGFVDNGAMALMALLMMLGFGIVG